MDNMIMYEHKKFKRRKTFTLKISKTEHKKLERKN